MLVDEIIVLEVWVRGTNSINLFELSLTERFDWIEALDVLQKTLAAQNLVQTRDATAKAVGRVEQCGIGVGHFHGQAQYACR